MMLAHWLYDTPCCRLSEAFALAVASFPAVMLPILILRISHRLELAQKAAAKLPWCAWVVLWAAIVVLVGLLVLCVFYGPWVSMATFAIILIWVFCYVILALMLCNMSFALIAFSSPVFKSILVGFKVDHGHVSYDVFHVEISQT